MRRLFVYAAVGGATALLYLAVAVGLTRYFGTPALWASVAGFVAAVPFSYLGHKLVTFRSPGEHRDELPRFLVTAIGGLALSIATPALVVDRWHAPPIAGYLAACVGVPILNYFLMWLWVFMGARKAREPIAAPGPLHRQ
jgi:putative flippase GtrA